MASTRLGCPTFGGTPSNQVSKIRLKLPSPGRPSSIPLFPTLWSSTSFLCSLLMRCNWHFMVLRRYVFAYCSPPQWITCSLRVGAIFHPYLYPQQPPGSSFSINELLGWIPSITSQNLTWESFLKDKAFRAHLMKARASMWHRKRKHNLYKDSGLLQWQY